MSIYPERSIWIGVGAIGLCAKSIYCFMFMSIFVYIIEVHLEVLYPGSASLIIPAFVIRYALTLCRNTDPPRLCMPDSADYQRNFIRPVTRNRKPRMT